MGITEKETHNFYLNLDPKNILLDKNELNNFALTTQQNIKFFRKAD